MNETVAIIHLHRVETGAVLKGLDQALREWKYERVQLSRIPPSGPEELQKLLLHQIRYLVGPRRGDWVTVLQDFTGQDDRPFLADVANRLSERLQTHSLALLLHEGVILFYNLDYRGTPRDGYVSNPQFLAEGKLTPAEIMRQRHQPKAFTPLLPKSARMDQLIELLNAGWWQAHEDKQLDESGDAVDEDRFPSEEERLTALGNLLQLHGKAGYPFAAWPGRRLIEWEKFQAATYQAKSHGLPMV